MPPSLRCTLNPGYALVIRQYCIMDNILYSMAISSNRDGTLGCHDGTLWPMLQPDNQNLRANQHEAFLYKQDILYTQ